MQRGRFLVGSQVSDWVGLTAPINRKSPANLGTVSNPAKTAHELYANGITTNGYYYIKPDLASSARQMYCYFTGNTGWIVIGRTSAQGAYAHAPGFFNDGSIPDTNNNGSISLFDWSDTFVNNNTRFRFFDPAISAYVEWYVENLTSIKAAPDTYINTVDTFKIRFTGESGNTSGYLYKWGSIQPVQNAVNVPNFSYVTASNPSYGMYGYALYVNGTQDSSRRGFLISNNSDHESAYGAAGLQRYGPSPFTATGILLLINPR